MHPQIQHFENTPSGIIVLNQDFAAFLAQAQNYDFVESAIAILSLHGDVIYRNHAFDNLFYPMFNHADTRHLSPHNYENLFYEKTFQQTMRDCISARDKIIYQLPYRPERLIQFDLSLILRPIKVKYEDSCCAIMLTLGEENYSFKKFHLARLQQERQELTERIKVISEDLMYKNRLVHDLFQDTPFAIMLFDNERNLIQMNRACETLFNTTTREATGIKCDQLLHCYQLQQRCPLLDNAQSVRLSETETCCGKIPGTVLLRSAVVLEHDNNKQVILEAFVDISDRKRTELELEQHREHLQALVNDKTRDIIAVNKELEAFCYSVSHDLRGPIRSINGFSTLLIDEYRDKLGTEGTDYAVRVHKASLRMGELIDDLLSLSRLSRDDLEFNSLDLTRLCYTVWEQISSSIPDHQTQLNVQNNMTVCADERMLFILLENLLGNSLKFTRTASQPCISIGTEIINGENTIYVKDNGAGFDMKYQAKLFQPFERLHDRSEFEGNGIGLAIVKRIINRHGGRIWASSEPGKGATFYFTLVASGSL